MIATKLNYNYKKLGNKVRKKYWDDGQRITLQTDVILDKPTSCSVYFCKKDWAEKDSIYLFDIISEDYFYDVDAYPNTWKSDYKLIEFYDYQLRSFTPFYFDREF